jgi:hypothetical protein
MPDRLADLIATQGARPGEDLRVYLVVIERTRDEVQRAQAWHRQALNDLGLALARLTRTEERP